MTDKDKIGRLVADFNRWHRESERFAAYPYNKTAWHMIRYAMAHDPDLQPNQKKDIPKMCLLAVRMFRQHCARKGVPSSWRNAAIWYVKGEEGLAERSAI